MLILGICDDLQEDRRQIVKLVKEYRPKENYDLNILTFENGETLVKHYIEGKTPFDIIFLDIFMSGENGIAIAKQLRKYDSACKIIFTTTSTEHALESFEVFPFNYLTKPIAQTVFDAVFEKAINTIENEKQKRLSFKSGSSIRTVFYKDILFIESDARTLTVHTTQKGSFAFLAKLDDIEGQINDKRFIRCHKSFLVNMDHILSMEGYSFKLNDSSQIPVTQRNWASIKKAFFDYILDKANLNGLDKVE